MKKYIILLFLTSCALPNSNDNTNIIKLNLEDDLSFDEYNQLIIKYAGTSPYPNIDQ